MQLQTAIYSQIGRAKYWEQSPGGCSYSAFKLFKAISNEGTPFNTSGKEAARMKFSLRLLLALALSLMPTYLTRAQESRTASPSATASAPPPAVALMGDVVSEDERKKGGGRATTTRTDKPTAGEPAIADPLIRVLVKKGVLTADEANAVGTGGTAAEQRDRLAALLRSKGLISDTEYEAVRTSAPTPAAEEVASTAPQQTPNRPEKPETATKPVQPAVIPAVAPSRPLQFDITKREGLIPDIKLGSGARVKLYGFVRLGIIHDSSSPGGGDAPLPLLAADTGPDASPEFHVKARFFRIGANFEWLDPSPKTIVTGRFEMDFEGNFTRVFSGNATSIRNPQPRLRLAWGRVDHIFSDKTSAFALFGQDWTPFCSSTLSNSIEITLLGVGYGTCYTRAPQARFGFNYKAGGARNWSFGPEFALVLPAFGDLPSDVANQLAFAERQGVDSHRPEVEGRFVTQFQLDRAPGVVPAQLIASFTQGRRVAIVTAAAVPAAFKAAFPNGVRVGSDRFAYTLEAQLPTRAVTVSAKYYNGEDLRFYNSGGLISNFNDTFGLTGTATAASIDGASTVVFGLLNGTPTVAPQRSVRSVGGFIELGFPLSRIFGADPKGRNAGWTANVHWGIDNPLSRDARRFTPIRGRSDWTFANIQYKLNSFVTFAYEQGYYRTRLANNSTNAFGGLPLFRGIPSRTSHDVHSEFQAIFSF